MTLKILKNTILLLCAKETKTPARVLWILGTGDLFDTRHSDGTEERIHRWVWWGHISRSNRKKHVWPKSKWPTVLKFTQRILLSEYIYTMHSGRASSFCENFLQQECLDRKPPSFQKCVKRKYIHTRIWIIIFPFPSWGLSWFNLPCNHSQQKVSSAIQSR